MLERKIKAGDIKSQAGIQKWRSVLKRLIESRLGELFVETVCPQDFIDWRNRSISGHATETMQRHYSTVSAQEQQNGLANVIRLIDFQSPSQGGEESGEVRSAGGEDQ